MESISVHKLGPGEASPLEHVPSDQIKFLDLRAGNLTLYLLPQGTAEGRSAVMFDVEVNGVHHLFQTTAAALKTAMVPVGVWTEDEQHP